MTTLAITPNWKNKTAKFKGTIAAGEHVAVTIQNDNGEGGEFIADASTLRLRVVDPCNGRTLAIFPEPVPEGETPEEWDSDLSPLRCTLNLNTVQMLKVVPPAANVPLLFVLDDYENKTLYFKEQFPVEHWPRLRGEEEPTDLDNYKDIIADFNTRLDGYDTRITGAENAAQAATANASAAAAKANQAVDTANQAVDKAETAQNSAAASAEAALNSALAAKEAQEAAESAAKSINSPDVTLTEKGVAADAKATGEAIAAEKTRAETAEAAEKTRAEGVESGLSTRLTATEEAINDEAVLRAAADADLESNKADKATTYTKTEVDRLVAAMGKCIVVDELPDPADADRQAIYLVPQTGKVNVYDEYIVVEPTAGTFVWNQLGDTEIDLSNYATKADATLTIKYVWDVEGLVLGYGWESLEYDNGTWTLTYNTGSGFSLGGMGSSASTATVTTAGTENATRLTFTDVDDNVITATRRTVLQLGEQSENPIQPAGNYIARGDVDDTVAKNGANPVKSSGIWSAIWGALASLPTGFSSLYDWCVRQLAGKANDNAVVKLTGNQTIEGVKSFVDGVHIRLNRTDSDFQIEDLSGDLGTFTITNSITTGRWCLFARYLDGSMCIASLPVNSGTLARIEDLAPGFSDSATYAVNALCNHENVLYRCTTAVTTAGDWTGSANWTPATVEDVLAALRTAIAGKANRASSATAGNLAALDAQGNPTDSQIPAANVALKSAIPYSLGTPIVVATAQSEVVAGETVYYGAATLANRTANIVQVAAPLDELRITFLSATSGKVRDFGLRVEIGTGSAALAAPALVPIAPPAETIKIENNAKEIPALADGTATAKGVTLLYFSETAPGVFVVKGEQVEEVA